MIATAISCPAGGCAIRYDWLPPDFQDGAMRRGCDDDAGALKGALAVSPLPERNPELTPGPAGFYPCPTHGYFSVRSLAGGFYEIEGPFEPKTFLHAEQNGGEI